MNYYVFKKELSKYIQEKYEGGFVDPHLKKEKAISILKRILSKKEFEIADLLWSINTNTKLKYTYREVADNLKCSYSMVHSTYCRARSKICRAENQVVIYDSNEARLKKKDLSQFQYGSITLVYFDYESDALYFLRVYDNGLFQSRITINGSKLVSTCGKHEIERKSFQRIAERVYYEMPCNASRYEGEENYIRVNVWNRNLKASQNAYYINDNKQFFPMKYFTELEMLLGKEEMIFNLMKVYIGKTNLISYLDYLYPLSDRETIESLFFHY